VTWRLHYFLHNLGGKLSKRPFVLIILSAILFGLSPPLAKLLVKDIHPVALAGFLYLGVFFGLEIYSVGRKMITHKPGMPSSLQAPPLEKKDFPWLAGAILIGGVIAPISLMIGLTKISGFSASLLLNLEGLTTALIAVLIFKEKAGMRLWAALASMTFAGIFLAWDPSLGKFTLAGPLFIFLAMTGWGLDNNFTRNISDKNPVQIAKLKGLFAGLISLGIVLILGIKISLDTKLIFALLIGALCYGLSLVFFIKALKGLGAFRAGAFFSFGPFIGALASLPILREFIKWTMFPATLFMLIGVWLIVSEKHSHAHPHEKLTHAHSHTHHDQHHFHPHPGKAREPHTHEHTHMELDHIHSHWPDTHHRHDH
jgi:drug/metabolite transporter (DMT)-like permease